VSAHTPNPASPVTSGITMIGALPPLRSAQASDTWSAAPASIHSCGAPGVPCSSITTGSDGRGCANQARGRCTSAGRAVNPDRCPGITTGTVCPVAGRAVGLVGSGVGESSSQVATVG
jgi:hypothetical protein